MPNIYDVVRALGGLVNHPVRMPDADKAQANNVMGNQEEEKRRQLQKLKQELEEAAKLKQKPILNLVQDALKLAELDEEEAKKKEQQLALQRLQAVAKALAKSKPKPKPELSMEEYAKLQIGKYGFAQGTAQKLPKLPKGVESPYELKITSPMYYLAAAKKDAEETALSKLNKVNAVKWNATDLKQAQDYVHKLALLNSSYYKMFKGTEYLPERMINNRRIAAQYDSMRQVYGYDLANAWLDQQFQRIVGLNQTGWELLWLAFTHAPSSMELTAIQVAGMALYGSGMNNVLAGIGDITGNEDLKSLRSKHVEGLNGFEDYINNIVDNPLSRYADKIEKSGTSHISYLSNLIGKPFGYHETTPEEAFEIMKRTATKNNPDGIAMDAIVATPEEEQSVINATTAAQALRSWGFTAASMLAGTGEALLVRGALNLGGKGLTSAAKAALSVKYLGTALNKLKAVAPEARALVEPLLVSGGTGTIEGALNALQTIIETGRKGQRQIEDSEKQAIIETAKQLYEDPKVNPLVTTKGEKGMTMKHAKYNTPQDAMADAIKIVLSQISDLDRKDMQDLVNFAAAKAGIHDFFTNSAINGLIHSTMTAGLLAKPVQAMLRNNRITSPFFRKSRFDTSIDEKGAIKVTPREQPFWNAYEKGKEIAGETIEEYDQNVSSDTWSGAAENNINEFIKHKYSGDGTVKVGDLFSSDYAAAWSAFTNSLKSKESVESAILGGLGSAMGSAVPIGRRLRRNEDGNLEYSSFFDPKNILRGYNKDGTRESTTDYLRRITPWRSGLAANVNELNDRKSWEKDMAERLTHWANDPETQKKFSDLSATVKFMQDMQNAAETNDQFSFRNSLRGKQINDALMLSHLQGSEYYNQVMEDLNASANTSAETVAKLREEGKLQGFEDMSDQEVADKVSSNAQKMLSDIQEIQKQSKSIDRKFGQIDLDTKEALIYGNMQKQSLIDRGKKLDEEINAIKPNIQSSVESTHDFNDLNTQEKKLFVRYGSLEAALRAKTDLEEQKNDLLDEKKKLEEEAKTLKDKKDKKESQREIKNKQKKIDKVNEQLKEFSDLQEDHITGNVVFNEQDIMNLDPVTRAEFLHRGAAEQYNSTHANVQARRDLNLKLNEKQELIDEATAKLNGLREYRKKTDKKKRTDKRIAKTKAYLGILEKEKKNLLKQLNEVQSKEYVKPYYNQQQQAVINNIVNQGNRELEALGSEDAGDFLDKVVDRGRIQRSIESIEKQQNEIQKDPNRYSNYVYGVKDAAHKDLLLRRLKAIFDTAEEHINDNEEGRNAAFALFSKDLDNLTAGASLDDLVFLATRAAAYEAKLAQKYANAKARENLSEGQEQRNLEEEEPNNDEAPELPEVNNTEDFDAEEADEATSSDPDKLLKETKLKYAEERQKKSFFEKYNKNRAKAVQLASFFIDDENLSNNDKSLLMDAILYLLGKGVDITDYDKAILTLSEADEKKTVAGKFRQYIEEKNVDRDKETRTTFTSMGTMANQYREAVQKLREFEAYQENTNPEIHPATEERRQEAQAPEENSSQEESNPEENNGEENTEGGTNEGEDNVEESSGEESQDEDDNEESPIEYELSHQTPIFVGKDEEGLKEKVNSKEDAYGTPYHHFSIEISKKRKFFKGSSTATYHVYYPGKASEEMLTYLKRVVMNQVRDGKTGKTLERVVNMAIADYIDNENNNQPAIVYVGADNVSSGEESQPTEQPSVQPESAPTPGESNQEDNSHSQPEKPVWHYSTLDKAMAGWLAATEMPLKPAVQAVIDEINNSKPDEDTQEILRNAICNILNDGDFQTYDDLLDNLSLERKKITEASTNSDEFNFAYDNAIKILEQAFNKVSSKQLDSQSSAAANQNIRVRNANDIATVDLGYVSKAYPDSWIARIYNDYNIDYYLSNNGLDSQTPIYFVTDSAITAIAHRDMGGSYSTKYNLPVIAAVEIENPSEEAKKTLMHADGKWLQPVAVLPSADRDTSGAARTQVIREMADLNKAGTHLIMAGERPLTTRAKRNGIVARSQDQNSGNSVYTNMRDDAMSNLPEDMQKKLKEMAGKSQEEKAKDPEYLKAKEALHKQVLNIVDRLAWNDSEKVTEVYNRTFRDGEKPVKSKVQSNLIKDSVSRKTGKTLQETLKSLNTDDVLEYNSVINALYHRVLSKLFNQGAPAGTIFSAASETNSKALKAVNTVEEGKEIAEKATKFLNDNISNYLYNNGNFTYNVNFDGEDKSNPSYTVEVLNKYGDTVYSFVFYPGKSDERDASATFIIGMLLDESGNLRDSYPRWNISKQDIQAIGNPTNDKQRDVVRNQLAGMIEDGLLNFSGTKTTYNIKGLVLNAPISLQNNRIVYDTEANTGNPENAQSPETKVRETQTNKGETVDPQSGTPIGPEAQSKKPEKKEDNQPTEAKKKAAAIAAKIVEDSKEFELLDDQTGYTKKGEDGRYVRVSNAKESQVGNKKHNAIKTEDVINELKARGIVPQDFKITDEVKLINNIDKLAKETGATHKQIKEAVRALEEKDYGDWGTPSTFFGNSNDAVGRDTMDEDSEVQDSYPGISGEDLNRLHDQFENLEADFKRNGITIVAKGVVASGTVQMTDANGNVHNVKVAGTLDFLGYDDKGNFYIFDMKTVRFGDDPKHSNKDAIRAWEDKKEKWSRQLSLYRDLLMKKYKINIPKENLRIITTAVYYPSVKEQEGSYEKRGDHLYYTPKGGKEREITSCHPTMQINDTVFNKGFSSLQLNSLFNPGYTNLNMSWNNLSILDKAFAEGIYNEAAEESHEAPKPKKVEGPATTDAGINQEGLIDSGGWVADTNTNTAVPTQVGLDIIVPEYHKLSKEEKEILIKLGIEDEKTYKKLVNTNDLDVLKAIKEKLECYHKNK